MKLKTVSNAFCYSEVSGKIVAQKSGRIIGFSIITVFNSRL